MTMLSRSSFLALCTGVSTALLLATTLRAQNFEYPGMLSAADLAPSVPLSGPGYRVREQVTLVDYYARFVIESDYGVVTADGVDMLELRIKELAAIRTLDEMSVGRVMVDSGGRRLRRPVDQVSEVAANPEETVRGVPAGVGRYLARGAERIGDVALDLSDAARDKWAENRSDKSDDSQSTEKRTMRERSGRLFKRLALREIGYQKIRRGLAQHLGVDPYSSNPLLRERLDDLAWAAWVGDRGASLGLGSVITGPLDMALDIAGDAHDLVWKLSPEDVSKRNRKLLASLSLRGKPARDFLRNGAFNPLRQTAFVDLLGDPGFSTVRAHLLTLATEAGSEREARYLIDMMHGLRDLAQNSPGYPRIGLLGSVLVLDDGSGSLMVVLPVDYVAWNEITASFALREEFRIHRPRLLVRGQVSERALQEFARAGWRVEQSWQAEG